MNEITYELNEDEAKTIATALRVYNNYLVAEHDKIAGVDGVSIFLVEAARAKYNELSQGASELHVALAQTFPVLRQTNN